MKGRWRGPVPTVPCTLGQGCNNQCGPSVSRRKVVVAGMSLDERLLRAGVGQRPLGDSPQPAGCGKGCISVSWGKEIWRE